MLQWWCPCQCWQHQPLPDLTSQRKHSPTTLVSSPQMAAAKLMEPVALLHCHSFIHIRDVAKIVSPARRGWLFFCASTQHMYAGKIIRSHFTARLVTKELAPSNQISSRMGNEIELCIFLHTHTHKKSYVKLLHSYIVALYFCGNRELVKKSCFLSDSVFPLALFKNNL